MVGVGCNLFFHGHSAMPSGAPDRLELGTVRPKGNGVLVTMATRHTAIWVLHVETG